MTRVTRETEAGRAYLDLQNRARREHRNTQELLTLYIVERWLARLSKSAHTEQFVLKGGMLLATFDARRPTADADALARDMANDEATVIERILEIASLPDNDGVEFRTDTVTAHTIRDEALYAGLRVTMDARLATATVRFRIDVNFGDPVTPAPQMINLPTLRPETAPIRILGYPIETVLAEKITTAITLGDANTRVRDYADIYTLISKQQLHHAAVHEALLATAEFRGTSLQPLSEVIDELANLRHQAYVAYRASLGADGEHLPQVFSTLVETVAAFADQLIEARPPTAMWLPQELRWRH
ncbi:nucleotidyl transferase AbiEii/AbiGii toxin family protein [Microlunatus parietis]|uniref:Nucleotidyl transferase AbiEii toxin, Type IV TA system n=1 Tax=Microlunatus parietis TaxID=682979 RepID=A0A7Y9IBX4_9ACTN|nr:nucleotidyl transferase AbiEii/AbiGii toxin family protein [Microlunatus parietis]NYE73852.1 hypothetical protein [Microlunatus parietis]